MTEFEFRNSPEQREALDKLLSNDTLRAALAILSERAKPRHVPEPRNGVHHDTVTSQLYNRLHGRQLTLDELWRLTRPNPAKPEDDELEVMIPYFHSMPDQMKAAMRDLHAKNKLEI